MSFIHQAIWRPWSTPQSSPPRVLDLPPHIFNPPQRTNHHTYNTPHTVYHSPSLYNSISFILLHHSHSPQLRPHNDGELKECDNVEKEALRLLCIAIEMNRADFPSISSARCHILFTTNQTPILNYQCRWYALYNANEILDYLYPLFDR